MDSLKPGQIAILAGGAVLLLFSFIDWGGDENAWSSFGIFTWPALFGVIAAGTLAASVFGNASLPEPILGFTWKQIRLVLAFTTILILVGFVMVDGDKGAGFWFSLLGGIALMAGAVMDANDSAAPQRPSSAPF